MLDFFLDNTFKYFINKLKLYSTSLMHFQLNFNKNLIEEIAYKINVEEYTREK